MRGVLAALVLGLAFLMVEDVGAQSSDDEVPAASEPEVHIDETTGERYVEARPSEELRRGRVVAPPWVIYGAGGLVSLATIALLIRRLRA